MSLKEEIKRLRRDLSDLSENESINSTVEVSRSKYGKHYPVLGEHVKYGFYVKATNNHGDLRSMIPLGYEIVVMPNDIGYSICDSLHSPNIYGSDYHQKKFGCSLTLKRAEQKAKERAKKALEIICRHAVAEKAVTSPNVGFVAV